MIAIKKKSNKRYGKKLRLLKTIIDIIVNYFFMINALIDFMMEKTTDINNNMQKIIDYFFEIIYRKGEIKNMFELPN